MWRQCKLCGCTTLHGLYCRPCHIKKKFKIEKYPYRFGKVRVISPDNVYIELKPRYENCLTALKNFFAKLIEKLYKV